MANYDYLGADDVELKTNPAARIPVAIAVDISGSMVGLIDEVNRGIAELFEALRNDPATRDAVELAIIEFNSSARVARDFALIHNAEAPVLGPASGGTNLGEAVNMALDMLEARKKDYRANVVDYYQPHLIVFSDGEPNYPYEEARDRVKAMCANRKLTFLPIVLGEAGAAAEEAAGVLREFSANAPIRAKDIVGFFQWYSKSLSDVGKSNPGDKVKMDRDGISGWGEW